MRFALCGAGRVGTSLARSLSIKGWDFVGYYSRRYPDFIPENKRLSSIQDVQGQDTVIIFALPDRAIAEVSRKVAPSMIVGHTSGSRAYRVLKNPEPEGRFSLHPLRSVPDFRMNLERGMWGIDGDERGRSVAEKIIKTLEGKSFYIEPEKKSLYHLAAVLSINFLTVLLSISGDLFKECGVEESVELELAGDTISSIKERGYLDSLTGPVERGDVKTIKKELSKLKDTEPELVPFITEFFRQNIKLLKRKRRLTENVDALDSFLTDFSNQ